MVKKCLVCEGEFYPEALKDGKCAVCAKEFPNANNRDEALRQTVPEKEQMSTLTEMRVRDIVKEELAKAIASLEMKKDDKKSKEVADRMERARAARSKKKETETNKETE